VYVDLPAMQAGCAGSLGLGGQEGDCNNTDLHWWLEQIECSQLTEIPCPWRMFPSILLGPEFDDLLLPFFVREYYYLNRFPD
jgi:hypothetical protein